MNPKISVILPVYNMARYLKECLDSVCCQSLSDIELICVDDGSTDDSVEILRRYALKDDRIKVVEQQNATASVARNKGLSMAKGEFVSFLDSDDMYYGENALSTLYELAKKEGCPVAGGAYMAFALTPETPLRRYTCRVRGLENVFLATQWQCSPGGLPNAARAGKIAADHVASLLIK